MIYPDTSVLMAIYLGETGFAKLLEWVGRNDGNLAVSGWLQLEFTSALAVKQRAGAIPAEREEAALASFQRQWLDTCVMLPINSLTYRRAAGMVSKARGLRGGDALHLAIAERHGAELFTFDRQQAELGADMGIKTRLI
jgi:predicted nucleic acid-binding protein